MVRQYPHTIYVVQAPDATQNEQGDWETTGSQTQKVFTGRFEPVNGTKGNAIIKGADGSQVLISGIIYMPIQKEPIKVGSHLNVVDSDGNNLVSDTVKQFYAGQLNMRIWV